MITAVVPAHKEAADLPDTVASLRAQTIPPDRIIVVSDNSTDATVSVARGLGVSVLETVGNTARKAGTLNQALSHVETDLVLVIDADTQLVPVWIERALGAMPQDVAAVGALFRAAARMIASKGL